MKVAFADTHYFIALLNPLDAHHAKAREIAATLSGRIVTTTWVLTELANFMAKGQNRTVFIDFLADLDNDKNVVIEPPTQKRFQQGLDLFGRRKDKDWSLTDCISFVVMESRRLTEALTADHHFQQAGFTLLLR